MRRHALLFAFVAVLPRRYEAQLAPVGCLVHGLKITPHVTNSNDVIRNVSNRYNCQTACVRDARCKYFSYDSTSLTCRLSGARFAAARGDGFVSGPASCTDGWGGDPCAAMPGPGFPGATPIESSEAWPMKFVPLAFECWPHGGITGKDLLPCEGVADKVVEDTATGWPGKCQGLSKVTVEAGSTCKQQCEQDIMCPSWQEVEEGENRTSCWHGLGYDCWDATRALAVRSAQRIMRGSYRLLMDLANYEVADLRNVFGADVFGRNIPVAEAVCKRTCLSLLSCEIWQVSTDTGCWVNDPSFKAIPYPPTTATFKTSSDAANHVVAGEYIQRLCKASGLRTTVPLTPTATPRSDPAFASENVTVAPANSTSTSEPQGSNTSERAPTILTDVEPSANRFVKGTAGGATYFEEAEAGVKHVVRAGCGACGSPPPCDKAAVVGDDYIQGLRLGEDFRCDMLQGGSTQAGVDGLAVTTTTTLGPTPAQVASTTGGLSSAEASGLILGLPWYVWSVLILLPCLVGVGLLVWLGKRPDSRETRRSKRSMSFDQEKAEAGAQGATQEPAAGGWQPLVSAPDRLDVQGQEQACQGAAAAAPQMLQQPTGQYPCMVPPTQPGVPVWAEGPQNVPPTAPLQPAPTSPLWGVPRTAVLQGQGAGGLAGTRHELDLVRVTPNGLEISPLQGPPPPGVPVISPVPN